MLAAPGIHLTTRPRPVMMSTRFTTSGRTLRPCSTVLGIISETQYVSFDSAVDLVDYHLTTIEVLLRTQISETATVAQEIALIFMIIVVLNIMSQIMRQ